MKTLYFKCKLLSDIILNQKAASEGPNTTLDFIPGSNFLGIVASSIYDNSTVSTPDKWEIFHSGKVRFGDAHPSIQGIRGLRIPAALFYPKMESINERSYLHHCIEDPSSEEYRKMQLKQCRSGFYAYNGNEAYKIATENRYAVKSAHDKNNRKSQDEQMFGYQSLAAGLDMIFSIEIDNENFAEIIEKAIVGKKKVGRSRSAQYGLVEITTCTNIPAKVSVTQKSKIMTVYADGRLIFLDKDGLPTLQPSAEQLGIKNGKILWDKSQVRSFCYAPYNYKRRCFDTDRCGIEKGSVFVVETETDTPPNTYIGAYNNEGFGAVIYNPEFLLADNEGCSNIKYIDKTTSNDKKTEAAVPVTPLVTFLKYLLNKENKENEVYPKVIEWTKKNKCRFNDGIFASQWGHIRSLAMVIKEQNALKMAIEEYIGHGVAKDKWEENGRGTTLLNFIKTLNDDNASITIVNLAAEMAKICRKEAKK